MVYVILRASFVLLSMITKLVNNSFLLCQLFLDDSERNIAAGKALGLRTALVGKRVRSKEADYALESIGSLRRAIPEIWGGVAVAAAGEQLDHGAAEKTKGMRSDLDSIIQPTSVLA